MNILSNTKQKVDILNKSGAYSITCNEYDAVYVGETGRNLAVRYTEHLRDQNSKIYKHMIINRHNMPRTNIKLKKCMNKGRAITIYENLIRDKEKSSDMIMLEWPNRGKFYTNL